MSTLTQALQDAVAEIFTLRGVLQSLAADKASQVTTLINNFINRPPIMEVYVDPVNGLDTNDGSTPAKARKSIDAVLSDMGSNATSILLLNDDTVRKWANVYAPLIITGVRKVSDGTIVNNARTINYIAQADNSPLAGIGDVPSGWFFNGPSLRTNFISFNLPTLPGGGLVYRAPIVSGAGLSVSIGNATLTVASSQAGVLFTTQGSRMTATISLALGSGATGHVFDGVGPGGNPNNLFQYATNITSA